MADYPASNAEIAPSLGRNLAGGVRSVIVPLLKPQTMFEDRITRLDLRLSKIVRITARLRVQLNVDAYNALNSRHFPTPFQQITPQVVALRHQTR